MSTVDKLLERLDGVRKTGAGKWISRCPGHDDRHASFSVRETEDSRVLCHCFAGCDTETALAAVGLTFDDLFPERVPLPGEKTPRVPRFNASELLRNAIVESYVLVVAIGRLTSGGALCDDDLARVDQAVSTLNAVRKAVSHA